MPSTMPLAAGPVETNIDGIDGVLYIGPDRAGGMLEVITVEDTDTSAICRESRTHEHLPEANQARQGHR
jgi:hypothetical protein